LGVVVRRGTLPRLGDGLLCAHPYAKRGVFNASLDAGESGIWQGDAGPAADEDDSVFVVTGNSAFDGTTKGREFKDSVLKLGFEG
jgi:hypothetical protein